jgi:Spy/CpxP family protein refolding chaperone
MRKLLFSVFLGATALFGQGPGSIMPFPMFPPELQKFLELGNTQVDAIRRANTDLDIYRARKQFRIAQVRAELREWTAKDPISAIELGLRYAELETINREIREEERKTAAKARGALTPAQMAKLKVLEEAIKLLPLIDSAACENLIDGPGTPVPMNIVPGMGIAGVPGAIMGPASGCIRGMISAVMQP